MFDKRLLSFIITLFLLLTSIEGAAASYFQSPSQGRGGRGGQHSSAEDLSTVVRQVKTGLSDVKNELNNHEIEIRTFEERLTTQEQMMDDLHQQIKDELASQSESARVGSIAVQGKFEVLDRSLKSADGVSKGMMADLRQLKEQSDDFVKILAQYKLKLIDLEKLVEAQNHQMENFETALNTVIDVLKGKDAGKGAGVKGDAQTYKVQSGDSLEKIARKHGVSVQMLRQANELTSDRIIIGQTLKIP
jgi:chromosome segregation ATPase